MDLLLGLFLWVALAIAAGVIAKTKSRSFFGYLLLTLLLPLIGLIVAIGVSNRTPPKVAAPGQDQKQCPHCAEWVQRAAIKCRFCGSDLATAPSAAD